MSDNPPYRPPDVAAAWRDAGTAASYERRPPYPPQTFDILAGLIHDDAPAVLDLGCGTGFVARPLAPRVHRIDAVDISADMIAEGKALPGGDHPGINWIVGSAEDVPLRPPYALVTAGDSLHWMKWGVVLPRIAAALSPNGMFALLSTDGAIVPEDQELQGGIRSLIQRYSTYAPPAVRLLDELQRHGFFLEMGRTETDPMTFRQSVDEYVESFHARASLSWARMSPEDAAAFDASLKRLLLDRLGDTVVQAVRGFVAWGKPLRGADAPQTPE